MSLSPLRFSKKLLFTLWFTSVRRCGYFSPLFLFLAPTLNCDFDWKLKLLHIYIYVCVYIYICSTYSITFESPYPRNECIWLFLKRDWVKFLFRCIVPVRSFFINWIILCKSVINRKELTMSPENMYVNSCIQEHYIVLCFRVIKFSPPCDPHPPVCVSSSSFDEFVRLEKKTRKKNEQTIGT